MPRNVSVLILIAVLLGSISPGQAQESSVERLLVPVQVAEPLPGGYGSLWTSVLFARNNSNAVIRVEGVWGNCQIPLCPPEGIVPPEKSVTLEPIGASDRLGALLRVDRAQLQNLAFSLRVRDMSRQNLTWGTEVPVVREREFRSDAVTLVGIPVSSDFRTTLRIYELEGTEGVAVRLRLFGIVPSIVGIEPLNPLTDALLAEHVVTLRPALFNDVGRSPGYLEISDVATLAGTHTFELLTLEMSPVDPTVSLWSFASVVHNVTQHLTVITPQ
ncbi:MAG TPA: hypothetical protein VGF40_00465 [Thermoanaerobaculia bacterium]